MKTTASFKLTLAVSLLGIAMSALPVYAQSTPAIRLIDGSNNIITIDSTGAAVNSGSCTPAACVTTSSTGVSNTNGQVSWNGTIGNFSFTATGQTAPLRPGIADINISNLSTGAAGGTLKVLFTVANVDGGGPYTMNQLTSFTFAPGSTATYTSFVDTTNTPFGTGTTLGTIGPTTVGSAQSGLSGPASHALSITDQVVLNMPDAFAAFQTDFYTMNSSNQPLSVSCAAGMGNAAVSYSSMLTANGGVPSYKFSIISGNLPPGLTFSGNTISGIPLADGTYSYIAQVTDSSGSISSETTQANCNIVIAAPVTPLSLTCPAATSGEAGLPYNSNLVGGGGTAKGYTYSVTGLPAFLSLNPTTGFITNSATLIAGNYTYTAQVVDQGDTNEPPRTQQCPLTVVPPPSLTCSGINTSGVVGTVFNSGTPTVTGGAGTLTFSTTPSLSGFGLTQNTHTGVVSGTPTAGGTFSIRVTDANGVTATGCPITIQNSQGQGSLSVSCPLGTATAGVPYSSTLKISGGVTPYTITVSAGSLPAGLTLNTVSTNGVVTGAAITGTPTTAGTSGFTIKVVDHAGTVATSSCTGSCGTAGTALTVDTDSNLGNLGNSYIYYAGTVPLTAYGFNNTTNNHTATALYAKNQGSTESGLGIASDSDHEINTSTFIQLDISKLVAAGFTNAQITFNSVQSGESYSVYGSNTLGTPGTKIAGPGILANTLTAMPGYGAWTYIGVTAAAGNVLIGDLAFTSPATTCTIVVAPAPVPKVSISKKANATKVNPFQKVTYTYTVTNTGTVPLANVVVKDDNATPNYTGDDFTVGTVASLAPGASTTFTATLIPPVTEVGAPQGWNGWGNDSWDNGGWGGGWGGSNSSPAGTLICTTLPNGNVQVTFRQDLGQTDNTYGRGSSSNWSGQWRNFSDMVGGQAAEFRFLDGNGNTVLDVATDYISKSSRFPSGYGTLGVSGGNGAVIKGDGSHVVSCDTTLSHNLNQSPGFYNCTTDSSGSPSWDSVSGYTIVVDGKTFGSAGFGGVAIPDCHNQHSIQWGCDDQKVSPTSSSSTNTATVTATGNGITVSATATATVQIDASTYGWSQCSKY
jgi:hypothetical protein